MSDFRLKRGFDIKLVGEAEKRVVDLPAPRLVAIKPSDFKGLKAKLEVHEGDAVKCGTPLFYAKSNPDIKFVSPVSGTVKAVKRGERRALMEIIIENDGKDSGEALEVPGREGIKSAGREKLQALMMQGGVWPFIIRRPFGKMALGDDAPRDIFISGMDTGPLAADMALVMQGLEDDFQAGIDALAQMTGGKVYLSLDANARDAVAAFSQAAGVEKNYFSGPHPAGNVGVQIHHIKPIKSGEVVWTVKPYGVAMIGRFLKTGLFPQERVVAVAGSSVKEPVHYKTVTGTSLEDLFAQNGVTDEEPRYISGNVLTGSRVLKSGFVGFYDNLISVIPEGPKERKLLGWYLPGFKELSHSRTFMSRWFPSKAYKVNTLLHGADRAFVMTGDYESVLPMDIYPVFLVKSVLANDFEEMEGLGILELDEEDVALCSYICPSKFDFGGAIRQGLDIIEKEG
ncbi:MAG TPA: Na(+)-translocating NADH-quinone reductase subunit A [Caldithrix abyssi]|uniref:Na(+)-translocating NADH-quinone reductase subunit A n=1 Tax=Caldithrix abyssi TaxID=187145 RepID=A0A7V5RQH2_CALAY|nr:Na(+)-translocating NADH-quinone reductase subunit A [Caldithrix abyssi]